MNSKCKKNRKEKGKWHLSLLVALCCILAGCSKTTEETLSEGTTVYVAERLETAPGGGYGLPDGFKKPVYIEHSLFFQQENSDMQAVSKAAFAEDGRMLGIGEAEILFALPASGVVWKGGTEQDPSEEEILAMLDQAVEAGKEAANQPEKQISQIDPGKIYVRFYLKEYAVDQEQNLYLAVEYRKGRYFSAGYEGCIFCKYTREGEWVYRSYFPGLELALEGLAADGEGGISVLTAEGILALDKNGRKQGQLKTEGDNAKTPKTEILLGDTQGHVYFFVSEALTWHWKGWKPDRREGILLQEVEGLSGTLGLNQPAVCGGNVFYSSRGTLYEYDHETAQTRSILLWENSNLMEEWVSDVLPVDDDSILIHYEEPKLSGLYLLEKTPIEELQEKQPVVLAALDASIMLRDAVIRFNRQSEEYQVVIESYGYTAEGAESAYIRRDAAMASSNPPDLLSLEEWDLKSCVEKGMLEDLNPYLEDSTVVDKNDLIGNVLEGYSVGGLLAGLPIEISITALAGRVSQVGNLDRWTMEEVYELVERYPEQTRLLSDASDYEMNTRQYLLSRFCVYWYLEKFVDQENGKCSFDNAEFKKFLEWVGENGKEQVRESGFYTVGDRMPEDALLMDDRLDFMYAGRWEIMFGEDIRLLGYPTADGKGKARVWSHDPLGILAKASNKEGAWRFMEFFLSQMYSEEERLTVSKSQLLGLMEEWTKPEKIDETTEKKYSMYMEDTVIPFYGTSRELSEQVLALLEEADYAPSSIIEDKIVDIILEETESYYSGDKSLDEVTGIIQNRVQLILDEQR